MIIGEVDRYIEENNGNKYLTFASTGKNKKVLKYTKLWDEIKYHIQTINVSTFDEYEKDYMRIQLYSNDDFAI